jgi:hypothetical protein
MTTLADLATRIQLFLQDTDVTPGNTAKIIQTINEAAQKLAQFNYFPQLTWVQAVTGTGLYTMPTSNVTIEHVLYNEHALRYITEDAFDHKKSGWEALTGEPKYWTADNVARNTFRVIPRPTRTGSAVPVIPPVPLIMPLVDNFLVFTHEDVSSLSDVSLPTLLDYDDWLVYYSTFLHASKETPQQNEPVAKNAAALAELTLQFLERNTTSGTP